MKRTLPFDVCPDCGGPVAWDGPDADAPHNCEASALDLFSGLIAEAVLAEAGATPGDLELALPAIEAGIWKRAAYLYFYRLQPGVGAEGQKPQAPPARKKRPPRKARLAPGTEASEANGTGHDGENRA